MARECPKACSRMEKFGDSTLAIRYFLGLKRDIAAQVRVGS